jgi:hypothetical protein
LKGGTGLEQQRAQLLKVGTGSEQQRAQSYAYNNSYSNYHNFSLDSERKAVRTDTTRQAAHI